MGLSQRRFFLAVLCITVWVGVPAYAQNSSRANATVLECISRPYRFQFQFEDSTMEAPFIIVGIEADDHVWRYNLPVKVDKVGFGCVTAPGPGAGQVSGSTPMAPTKFVGL